MEKPLFSENIDNVKAVIEMDKETDADTVKCTLSLTMQDDRVIVCAASSESSEIAIKVAARRAQRALRRLIVRPPLWARYMTGQVSNTMPPVK